METVPMRNHEGESTISRRKRKLRKRPHIIKFNGNVRIGSVTVVWGDDDTWMESVESILYELIKWKRGGSGGRRFMALAQSEGPEYLLVENMGELSTLGMCSPKIKIYDRIMRMESFANRFVSDLEHFLTDEGKRKRWSRPWLPKNGKLEVKRLLKMVDEYNGKTHRVARKQRRGAARMKREPEG